MHDTYSEISWQSSFSNDAIWCGRCWKQHWIYIQFASLDICNVNTSIAWILFFYATPTRSARSPPRELSHGSAGYVNIPAHSSLVCNPLSSNCPLCTLGTTSESIALQCPSVMLPCSKCAAPTRREHIVAWLTRLPGLFFSLPRKPTMLRMQRYISPTDTSHQKINPWSFPACTKILARRSLLHRHYVITL